MAEVLVRYTTKVRGKDGTQWVPQACGGVASDGLWEGWVEFVSEGRAIRTGRETQQPNRDDLMYWAQGLTDTYLDGALVRATTERTVIPREPMIAPQFDQPAPRAAARGFRPRAILDPFATYAQGEDLLHGQLSALSHDNLVAIVDDYALPIHGTADMRTRKLVDAIVDAVKYARRPTEARQAPVSEAADPARTESLDRDD